MNDREKIIKIIADRIESDDLDQDGGHGYIQIDIDEAKEIISLLKTVKQHNKQTLIECLSKNIPDSFMYDYLTITFDENGALVIRIK